MLTTVKKDGEMKRERRMYIEEKKITRKGAIKHEEKRQRGNTSNIDKRKRKGLY